MDALFGELKAMWHKGLDVTVHHDPDVVTRRTTHKIRA